MVWSRLIRFTDDCGRTTFGEPCIDHGDDLIPLFDRQELFAIRLSGIDPFALSRTDEKVKVRRLLGVLTEDNVAIFKCIGLNYRKHIAETGRKPPPYPSLFMKPAPATAGFDDDICVPGIAQGKNLDYEGELVRRPSRVVLLCLGLLTPLPRLSSLVERERTSLARMPSLISLAMRPPTTSQQGHGNAILPTLVRCRNGLTPNPLILSPLWDRCWLPPQLLERQII